MPFLGTDKQRENLAKFFWDMAKIAFTFFVLVPVARQEEYHPSRILAGLIIGFTLLGVGYMLDGRESQED